MTVPVIFNIQKFSVHDGPGIRTTVFFKGCPIRCAWCHNPESQLYQIEEMPKKNGKMERVGQSYTLPELIKEIAKDQLFYEQSGGGVTLSGGEVMTQDMAFIEPLVKQLKRKGISVAIDTCGVAPFANYERLLPYVDLFLYDLKFIDSQLHETYTGTSNELVLANLRKLSEAQANIDLRLIMLEGINADDETAVATISWLKAENIAVSSVHLLPYHEFGKEKYLRLNRESQSFQAPSDERMAELQNLWTAHYQPVKIGG
ncbi:glycyl-radical enzyme activating protein [Vagococcus sp. BWB3-3]|uniref:Glycyl-radical enzyme activating protein n=1 Tax=Vagococcus allomyrinae TaxID=2794353 RepID=A0A940SW31_9ENTE|nr:glycyl-radical enzyme activating protein [Vagococcus allomyrinae]MBP1042539.1 glycyl-radical enzyme activating protein [Vagococcus allomyrinae]